MKPICILLLALFSGLVCLAQSEQDDYFKDNRTLYEDHTYLSTIKTVLLHREGNPMSIPLIMLGADEKLQLSFDDLSGGDDVYEYTFTHCTAEWQASNLQNTDYLQGFLSDRITTISYSFNTNQRYSHRTLLFPNESIQLTKSGNYLLLVYRNGDPKQAILTRRFMVAENKVTLEMAPHASTIGESRKYKQELDFTIFNSGYIINNPFGELKTVITQNGRWDNAIRGLQPRFLKDKELVYDYEEENIFNGGNEFRFLDFRNFKYRSENVQDILYEPAPAVYLGQDTLAAKFLHIVLQKDPRRSAERYYSTRSDLNGKFLVSVQEEKNPDTEADYAFVYFRLPVFAPLADGNIYVGGGLTDWSFGPDNRMAYDPIQKCYTCTLFLKQGYYNYEYFFLKDGSDKADETCIEGDHAETGNSYAVYVYQREPGGRYDRLIGHAFAESNYSR